MKLMVKYAAKQIAQSFCMDQVVLYYNSQSLQNFDSDNYNVFKWYNVTRYEGYAKKYPLVVKSKKMKARITWDNHVGHYLAREDGEPWRVSIISTQVTLYRYYLKCHTTRYRTDFPTAGIESLLVFFVYRLDAYAERSHEENYLLSTYSVAYETERGICFTPKKFASSSKTSIRIHGVDNDIGHQEFSDWGKIADPTKLGLWNVIGVHWDVRPGHTSSVWINYGKDYKGGRMFTFKAAAAKEGSWIMIGNTDSRFSGGALDGALTNIEVYDSKLVDDHVIAARMWYLSEYYNIEDTIYK